MGILLKMGQKIRATLIIALTITAVIGLNNITQQMTTETHSASLFTAETLNAVHTISAAPVVANDSNWAGYIVASDLNNPQPVVTSVSASWAVPNVTPSLLSDKFSAIWIGIG